MFVSNPSTLAHICQSIRYNLVSVLLLSCFVKVRCLSDGFRSTPSPKSNPIHTIFTNCAPFPLHFHSISISIWISTPLKGSTPGTRTLDLWIWSPAFYPWATGPPIRSLNRPVERCLNDFFSDFRIQGMSWQCSFNTMTQNRGHIYANQDYRYVLSGAEISGNTRVPISQPGRAGVALSVSRLGDAWSGRLCRLSAVSDGTACPLPLSVPLPKVEDSQNKMSKHFHSYHVCFISIHSLYC